MASTYSKLQYHLIFSTKNRMPSIHENGESRLFAYLNGCLCHGGCVPVEIGGYRDHIHILTGMKPTQRVCDVVCDVKAASSRWVHDSLGLKSFAWQDGYGAFTVEPGNAKELIKYIQLQKEHHREKSFLEEYMELLNEAQVVWDPRYLG